MRIITKSTLKNFWQKYPNSKNPLLAWYKITSGSDWKNFSDVRQVFSSADMVGQLTVFNIGGNKYRLITKIAFATHKVYIRAVLTHTEYDKGNWKKDSWF